MIVDLPVLTQSSFPTISIIKPAVEQPEEPPEPIEYIVVEGDTLENIALNHSTSPQRLFSKNSDIVDPNVINIGQKVLIPLADEKLEDRPYPVTVMVPPKTPESSPSGSFSSSRVSSRASSGASSGNRYTPGYCTFYAKNMRSDLPNNLGNADTWGIRAAQQGFTVNNTPSVGAIGVAITYMHVAYVQQVDGDRVLVSEMNYERFGLVSSRWTTAREFEYIH